MRWRETIRGAQWMREDGRYLIYKDGPDCWLAWGPEGSQNVHGIRANTARFLREKLRQDCDEERLHLVAGRELIGAYITREEAVQACSRHDLEAQ